MIFVTVGTHEQQFDRLIKYIDELKGKGKIKEDVLMQIGYCTYIPKYCKYKKFIPYTQMLEYTKQARIVITHGGPSSFIMPLQFRKIPIVVPRQEKFNEHINNHQVEFSMAVSERKKNIITVLEIEKLIDTIQNYEEIIQSMTSELDSNNENFNNNFSEIVRELV